MYHGEKTGVLMQGMVVVQGGNHEVHPSSLVDRSLGVDVLLLLVESWSGKVAVESVMIEVTVWKIVTGLSGVTVTKTVVGIGAGHVNGLLPLSPVGSSGDGKPGNGPDGAGAEKAPNGPVMTVVKPLGRVEVKVVENALPSIAPVAWFCEIVRVSVKPLVRVVVSVVDGPSDGGAPGGP